MATDITHNNPTEANNAITVSLAQSSARTMALALERLIQNQYRMDATCERIFALLEKMLEERSMEPRAGEQSEDSTSADNSPPLSPKPPVNQIVDTVNPSETKPSQVSSISISTVMVEDCHSDVDEDSSTKEFQIVSDSLTSNLIFEDESRIIPLVRAEDIPLDDAVGLDFDLHICHDLVSVKLAAVEKGYGDRELRISDCDLNDSKLPCLSSVCGNVYMSWNWDVDNALFLKPPTKPPDIVLVNLGLLKRHRRVLYVDIDDHRGAVKKMTIGVNKLADPVVTSLGTYQQAHTYTTDSGECAAFLSNFDRIADLVVMFNNMQYILPRWSIRILSDYKNVVYNTVKIVYVGLGKFISNDVPDKVKECKDSNLAGTLRTKSDLYVFRIIIPQLLMARHQKGIIWAAAMVLICDKGLLCAVMAWAVSELAEHHPKCQAPFAQNNVIRLLMSQLDFKTVEEHGKYAIVRKHKMFIQSVVMANNDHAGSTSSNAGGKGDEDVMSSGHVSHPMGNQATNQMHNVLNDTLSMRGSTPNDKGKQPLNPSHPNHYVSNKKSNKSAQISSTSIKGREFEDLETKAHMKAMAAKALLNLRKENLSICRSITESRVLLCFAILVENVIYEFWSMEVIKEDELPEMKFGNGESTYIHFYSNLSPNFGSLAATDINMMEANKAETSTIISQGKNQVGFPVKTNKRIPEKGLPHEVMVGSTCAKHSKVKNHGYVFMVLEYGEIDLAHMWSQKWKDADGCDQIKYDNWLPFYWQQILVALNAIHEETWPRRQLTKALESTEVPLVNILVDMELWGIGVDMERCLQAWRWLRCNGATFVGVKLVGTLMDTNGQTISGHKVLCHGEHFVMDHQVFKLISACLLDCLGTNAQSGITRFLKALNDGKDGGGDNNLIGQLGDVFYSAFLVADKVVVSTKSPIFWLPRPQEVTDLEDKVNFKGGGMMQHGIMGELRGANCDLL